MRLKKIFIWSVTPSMNFQLIKIYAIRLIGKFYPGKLFFPQILILTFNIYTYLYILRRFLFSFKVQKFSANTDDVVRISKMLINLCCKNLCQRSTSMTHQTQPLILLDGLSIFMTIFKKKVVTSGIEKVR